MAMIRNDLLCSPLDCLLPRCSDAAPIRQTEKHQSCLLLSDEDGAITELIYESKHKKLQIFLTLRKIQPNTEKIVLTFPIAVGGRVRTLRRRWRRHKGSGEEENYVYEENENDYEENNDDEGEEYEDYEEDKDGKGGENVSCKVVRH